MEQLAQGHHLSQDTTGQIAEEEGSTGKLKWAEMLMLGGRLQMKASSNNLTGFNMQHQCSPSGCSCLPTPQFQDITPHLTQLDTIYISFSYNTTQSQPYSLLA